MKGTIPNKKVRRGAGAPAGRDERLSSIAHDLNNALSPMLMAVSLLRPKVSDERGARILTLLAENAKRGADLVRQIQAIAARGEGGRARASAAGDEGMAVRPGGRSRPRKAPGGRK
ncbi:MAG: histidine kinase dimerization/phospho-acceptor domain-containing protein [Opitutaceae bacterium]